MRSPRTAGCNARSAAACAKALRASGNIGCRILLVLYRLIAIPVLCIVAGASLAQDGAAGLRARHAELQQALASSLFGSPLHLASSESSDSVSGNIYAIIAQPFSTAAPALERPAAWCEILFLHQNTKYCRPSPDAKRPMLNVVIGKKYDQP